jgi:hypothetical protein
MIVQSEVDMCSKSARTNHVGSDMGRKSVRLLVPTLYNASLSDLTLCDYDGTRCGRWGEDEEESDPLDCTDNQEWPDTGVGCCCKDWGQGLESNKNLSRAGS